jgi:ATP-dependent protease HslVU (ClpYQ) peptidase subunit
VYERTEPGHKNVLLSYWSEVVKNFVCFKLGTSNMTTIVYDHAKRQMASDGRAATGNLISAETEDKWIRDGDDFWFICGSTADRERLIKHFKDAEPSAPKWPIQCSALLVRDKRVYHCVVTAEGEPCKSEIKYSDSMGSGGDFGLAALDHGASAREAVAYAATRDVGTGGKITVFDIEASTFEANDDPKWRHYSDGITRR